MLLVSVPRNRWPNNRPLETMFGREPGTYRNVWSVIRSSDVSYEMKMITKRGWCCVCGVSSRWHSSICQHVVPGVCPE
jgi:hypothetical protein